MEEKIVLSQKEETSILLDGNFDDDYYSKNIKFSLLQALAMNTKISEEIKLLYYYL